MADFLKPEVLQPGILKIEFNFGSVEAQWEVPFLGGISRQVGDESEASQLSIYKVSLYLVTFSKYENSFKDIVTYIY